LGYARVVRPVVAAGDSFVGGETKNEANSGSILFHVSCFISWRCVGCGDLRGARFFVHDPAPAAIFRGPGGAVFDAISGHSFHPDTG